MPIRPCPLCHADDATVELKYEPREFDQCVLARQSLVKVCRACGMVYTDHGIDNAAIASFYETNSLYSGDAAGFGTGGATPADRERYEWYTTLLARVGTASDTAIVDLGCGRGGFIGHLRERGFTNIRAIDADPRCVEYARRTHRVDARTGSAEAIPFADESIEVIVAAQVIEHLGDLHRCMRECRRVLKPDGFLLIEVPDASRYAETRLYDFAWVALTEHINHFTAHTLEHLARLNGFSVITSEQADRTLNAPHCYPSLCMILKQKPAVWLEPPTPDFGARDRLSAHIEQEWRFAHARARRLETLFASGNRIACRGISREFFNLVRFSGLDPRRLYALYDTNPLKQALTVCGLPVADPHLMPLDAPDLTLIVTSVLHSDAIVAELAIRHFAGTVQTLDQCASPVDPCP